MRHPMFSEEHELFRDAVRKFVEKELTPHAEEWEEA
ncbi:MAG TPA: acyl-CoA dehydrogenase family protein, partial [Thermodesulfobacteriota bacterium]|nr:acyl-CoA dehydrogenase family protein [Thermodesulfobacteriota bacterium]